MATPSIKTRVELGGEKEYKSALSEINSGLKVLQSEMKLTQTKFEENADSVEALTEKNDVLERSILSQKEKVETLRAALQNSAETYGEADKKTDAWKVSLNNAEAALIKMERELEDNRKALQDSASAFDEVGEAAEEMADSTSESSNPIGDLINSLGIDLPDGASKAVEALGGIDGQALAAGGIGAAIAVITEVEQALIDLTNASAEAAAKISNTSATIGMSTEAAQMWDYVLKTVGSSIDDAQGDLSALQEKMVETKDEAVNKFALAFEKLGVSVTDQNGNFRNTSAVLYDLVLALQGIEDETERNAALNDLLGESGSSLSSVYSLQEEQLAALTAGIATMQEKTAGANVATGEAAALFEQLGVAVTDQEGNLRSTEEVLYDVVVALQDMKDETERNAAASTLLGGTGEDLVPILQMEQDELDALMEKKRELGILTDDEIEQLNDVSKSTIDFNEHASAAGNAIATAFSPSLASFNETMGETLLAMGESSRDSGLVNLFAALLDVIEGLLPLLDGLFAAIEILAPVFDILSIALGAVADVLTVITNAIAVIFNFAQGDFDGVTTNMKNIWGIFGEDSATARAAAGVGSEVFKWILGVNASGNYNFQGGFTWVGENGPEPVWLPRGSRIGTAQDGRSLGGDVFNVTISAKDVREFNDIVNLARAHRRKGRMEGK